ncbi:MAG: hypothetical protein ABR534_04835 [Desulfotignum sp.]|nr:PilZ domain-containing protein [Desulfobacteraceae bacterium]
MNFDIKKIFAPGKGVDLVFNMNAPMPMSRASIIFDADYSDNTITIAQPFVPVSPKTEYDTLHVTAVIPGRHQNMRVGMACRVRKFIDRYPLAGNTVSKALVLQCDLPVFETNIRSAFRLPLSKRHLVRAKLHFWETDFYTAADFTLRDISFAGIGIMIPKKVKNRTNPLTRLKHNDILSMGLVLVDTDKENPVGSLAVTVQVKRIDTDYSKTHILAGLKIIRITRDNETLLNKFIHDAQIAELKRISTLR